MSTVPTGAVLRSHKHECVLAARTCAAGQRHDVVEWRCVSCALDIHPLRLAAQLIVLTAVLEPLQQHQGFQCVYRAQTDFTPQQLGRLHVISVQQGALQTQGQILLASARASSTPAFRFGSDAAAPRVAIQVLTLRASLACYFRVQASNCWAAWISDVKWSAEAGGLVWPALHFFMGKHYATKTCYSTGADCA